jgi:hypothetical protein
VVKAIHAVCETGDGHQFPASHMVGDTWISNSYEGEVARCLPGSTLKAMVGSVVSSNQGMTADMEGAQVLQCGPHEALRHYKNGMLKCAPAEKVPDCTERTNLRKYGTGDMFFSFVTRVCLSGKASARASSSQSSYSLTSEQRRQAAAFASKKARELHLSGMTLNGGVGQGGY